MRQSSPQVTRSGREALFTEFRFQECHRLANELITLARCDPATARQLRDSLRFGRRDRWSLAGVDALLNELGSQFLVPEAIPGRTTRFE